MRVRALPIVLALVAADYMVWTWATSGQQTVPAVVTGLALPPLSIALAWITLLTVLAAVRRVASELGRRSQARTAARRAPARLDRSSDGVEPARAVRRRLRRRIAA